MEIKSNPQKKNIWISLGFGLLGVFMMMAPSLLDINIMNGGGALIFIGILIFLTSIPVAVMFYKRFRLLDSILNGRNVLVHWRYEPQLWAQYADEEEVRNRAGKIQLFLIIAGFAFVVGLLFFIIDPEEGGLATFLTMLGLIVVIGITAFLSIRIKARRNRTAVPEVYIAPDGIYFNRDLHSWKHVGSHLDSVRIVEARVPVIEFVYAYMSKQGMDYVNVNVPIPAGEMEHAFQIAGFFNNEGLQEQ